MRKERISQFERIKNKFRYGLVLHVLRNKLAKFGIELTPYYWSVVNTTDTDLPLIDGIISEYSVVLLETGEMGEIAISARGYTEKDFLSRLESGMLCFGLKHFDEIAAFMWVNLTEFNFDPINTPLEKDEAYLKEMYTMETYRGKNLAPFLQYKSYKILNEMGRLKLFSATEYFNSSAIRYLHKTNAKIIRLVLFIKLFNKIKWKFTLKTY